MSKRLVKCDTPYCPNMFFVNDVKRKKRKFRFCNSCKQEHSYHVLIVQTEHGKVIDEIILDARIFNTAVGMSDYIGVSFVTMYHWIRKYFGMTFQQFSRKYICKSTKCYLLNLSGSPYSRDDYVLKKIKDKGYCACINELEPGFIMTNSPVSVVSSIFIGNPEIKQYSEGLFLIMPKPIYFENTYFPVYFEQPA